MDVVAADRRPRRDRLGLEVGERLPAVGRRSGDTQTRAGADARPVDRLVGEVESAPRRTRAPCARSARAGTAARRAASRQLIGMAIAPRWLAAKIVARNSVLLYDSSADDVADADAPLARARRPAGPTSSAMSRYVTVAPSKTASALSGVRAAWCSSTPQPAHVGRRRRHAAARLIRSTGRNKNISSSDGPPGDRHSRPTARPDGRPDERRVATQRQVAPAPRGDHRPVGDDHRPARATTPRARPSSARRNELGKGALYYYIGSKEELLAAIHDRVMDEVLARRRPRRGSRAARRPSSWRCSATELLDVIARYPDHVWVFLHEFPALTGDNATQFRARRREYEHHVEAVLEAGIESGDFRDLDPKLTARAWLGMHNYTYLWLKAGGSSQRGARSPTCSPTSSSAASPPPDRFVSSWVRSGSGPERTAAAHSLAGGPTCPPLVPISTIVSSWIPARR